MDGFKTGIFFFILFHSYSKLYLRWLLGVIKTLDLEKIQSFLNEDETVTV